MERHDVVEILDLLEEQGVQVWLNGGWGVDALLGRQTRHHDDLDITIASVDRYGFSEVMARARFLIDRVDNYFNWVLVDSKGRRVDVHLVDFSRTVDGADKVKYYGPDGLPFPVGSLEGRGVIGRRSVNCETAEFQVQGHTGYAVDENDYRDVLALCNHFDIPLPEVFTREGFHLQD
jgi:lincosamide nucleotidyltransferase A/C/D/E